MSASENETTIQADTELNDHTANKEKLFLRNSSLRPLDWMRLKIDPQTDAQDNPSLDSPRLK